MYVMLTERESCSRRARVKDTAGEFSISFDMVATKCDKLYSTMVTSNSNTNNTTKILILYCSKNTNGTRFDKLANPRLRLAERGRWVCRGGIDSRPKKKHSTQQYNAVNALVRDEFIVRGRACSSEVK